MRDQADVLAFEVAETISSVHELEILAKCERSMLPLKVECEVARGAVPLRLVEAAYGPSGVLALEAAETTSSVHEPGILDEPGILAKRERSLLALKEECEAARGAATLCVVDAVLARGRARATPLCDEEAPAMV